MYSSSSKVPGSRIATPEPIRVQAQAKLACALEK